MDIILVFGLLMLLVLFLECVLSGTWNPIYFLSGIPIYSKEIEISDIDKASREIVNLISRIDAVPRFSNYKGKKLSENIFAFRKRLITFSFFRNDFENIHGIISIDSENRTLEIKGYFQYSYLAIILYFFAFYISSNNFDIAHIIVTIIVISLLSIIYCAFSRRKYKELYTVVSNLVES